MLKIDHTQKEEFDPGSERTLAICAHTCKSNASSSFICVIQNYGKFCHSIFWYRIIDQIISLFRLFAPDLRSPLGGDFPN